MTYLRKTRISAVLAMLVVFTASILQATPSFAAHSDISQGVLLANASTATPIKHVIVIIGENHTFDNVFGTYQPEHNQTISNLLSKQIVNCAGDLGPQVHLATQQQAIDTHTYSLAL
jgi:phospholipase C